MVNEEKKRRLTYWYIEPIGDYTNENIAQELAAVCAADADNTLRDFPDNLGKTHDLWNVPHKFVTKLERSELTLHFRFKIFYRKEGEEIVREWPFKRKGSIHRTKAVRKMKKQLKEL